jgi:hypothetical protein
VRFLANIIKIDGLLMEGFSVSDSSGRYNGLSFFDNDSWLGSKASCKETNRQIERELRKAQPNLPELEFVIIRVLATINPIFKKVRDFYFALDFNVLNYAIPRFFLALWSSFMMLVW